MCTLTEAEEKIIDIMKSRGFEKDLIIGTLLCCSRCEANQEMLDFLLDNEDCDDQAVLKFICEMAKNASQIKNIEGLKIF